MKDAPHQKKILFLEDDSFLHDLMSQKLAAAGVELMHAASGQEFFERLKEATPDLILTDLVLPQISGFEILRKMREDPQHANIPVIVLSNLSQKKDIDEAKSLGVVKFLTKVNVTPGEIVEEVLKTLTP
jgi:CheY-like chemotaxis protein